MLKSGQTSCVQIYDPPDDNRASKAMSKRDAAPLGTNILIIGPRQTGKSSLLRSVLERGHPETNGFNINHRSITFSTDRTVRAAAANTGHATVTCSATEMLDILKAMLRDLQDPTLSFKSWTVAIDDMFLEDDAQRRETREIMDVILPSPRVSVVMCTQQPPERPWCAYEQEGGATPVAYDVYMSTFIQRRDFSRLVHTMDLERVLKITGVVERTPCGRVHFVYFTVPAVRRSKAPPSEGGDGPPCESDTHGFDVVSRDDCTKRDGCGGESLSDGLDAYPGMCTVQ